MTFLYRSDRLRPVAHGAAPAGGDAKRELRFLPREEVAACVTFRDACVLAWKSRTFEGLTESHLATVCDLTQQHVSDYFRADARDEKGRKRRQLPADKIDVVQQELGNCAIGQWLARDMGVRLVEEFFAMERAA